MDAKALLDCSLILIALINPVSKIILVAALADEYDLLSVKKMAMRASLVAVLILVAFTLGGNFLLEQVFHVDIFAFTIAGGLVLALRGYQALEKGVFFDMEHHQKLEDLSIVPVASPMIAGPATISAALSFPAQYGLAVTSVGILIAIGVNLMFMLLGPAINRILVHYHIAGALIRITGLAVMTIGIQMTASGVLNFLELHKIILR